MIILRHCLYFIGLENLCLDIEYMLGVKTSFYWRCCWGVIMPAMMITVFIYALATSETLKFGEDYYYPTAGYGEYFYFIHLNLCNIYFNSVFTKNKST